MVPIDIPVVAKDLGVDENSVFGRLYHHLEEIHGQKRDPDNRVPRKAFFHPSVGSDVVTVSRQMVHARPSITLDIYFHEFSAVQHRDIVASQLIEAFSGILVGLKQEERS